MMKLLVCDLFKSKKKYLICGQRLKGMYRMSKKKKAQLDHRRDFEPQLLYFSNRGKSLFFYAIDHHCYQI